MNNEGVLTGHHALSNKRKKAVRVEIADSGVGIDEKDLSKIFDPFFTQKRRERGWGSRWYMELSIHTGHDRGR